MTRPLRFLLAGSPVAHSLSPLMQAAALAVAGLDGSYEVVDTDEDGLAAVVEGLRGGTLDGINVTMPLKKAAFRLADTFTKEAEGAGSVNTFRYRSGKVEGHSTDAVAISRIAGLRCASIDVSLVLGAGGAASAAVFALGDRRKYVSARRSARAAEIASRFNETEVVPWGTGVAGALVVNATPLGMEGENLPPGPLEVAGCLIDLAYSQAPTAAVVTARAAGIPIVDGVEFLGETAAAAFEWWTDVVVEPSLMVEAARKPKGYRD